MPLWLGESDLAAKGSEELCPEALCLPCLGQQLLFSGAWLEMDAAVQLPLNCDSKGAVWCLYVSTGHAYGVKMVFYMIYVVNKEIVIGEDPHSAKEKELLLSALRECLGSAAS